MSLTTELNALLGRISTPAKEIRDMLVVKGAYDDTGRAAETTLLKTLKGTEFALKIAIADKTTIVTAGLLLTAASTVGELILKRVTLQNDSTATTGNTGGALIYSDDADYPLNVELASAVFAASEFLGVDVGYPIQLGKKVGIKAVTGDCVGTGKLVITLVFVRNADGAAIAAV